MAQIYTASLDGTIKLWEYAEGTVQQTWIVGEGIEEMVLPSRQAALLVCRSKAGGAARVHTYSFQQRKILSERAVKLSAPGPLVGSPNSAFAATIDRNSVIVICLNQPNAKPLTLHHTKPITVRTRRLCYCLPFPIRVTYAPHSKKPNYVVVNCLN